MKVVTMQDKPLCSPEFSAPAGGTIELPDKMADTLIKVRAAKLYVDPAKAATQAKAARVAAVKALAAALKTDIAAVKAQVKQAGVKPGAVKADIEAAAEEAIQALTDTAEEAIASL